MNRPVHFEIQAEDTARAMTFYEAVFGWKFERWAENDYWMIMTAEKDSAELGINGGLMPRPKPLAEGACGLNAFACTMLVANFDETAAKIIAANGRLAMAKFALPGMAWQGYFLDTEGNTFGIHQPDPNAK